MVEQMTIWASLVERSPLPTAITTSATHRLSYVNAAFTQLTGVAAQTLIGRNYGDAFPETRTDGVQALLDRVLRTGVPEVAADRAHVADEGQLSYWTFTVWPSLDADGRSAGLVLQLQDTTQHVLVQRQVEQTAIDLRQVNEQLLIAGLREQARAMTATQEALHDSLTGLPNRILLLDRLEQALPVAHREPTPFALLLLDLDHFKQVNDSLGHLAGDRLLIEVAQRLRACLRPEDTVARLGGDEFAILLTTSDEVSAVMHVATRIQASLSATFQLGAHAVLVSASIGIVLSMAAHTTAEELLGNADIALYRAKALGRAQHVIFDPTMQAHALALAQQEADLRRAIAGDELCIRYQPIVAPHTGLISGVAAHLCWQHPTRGFIMASAFLADAEATGLIVPLEEWLLATGCAQAWAWQAADLPALYLSVKISAHYLKRRDFISSITEILQQTGLAAHNLHLELDVNSLMGDAAGVDPTLQQLNRLGVRMTVAGFGTGYASLSALRRLPLTAIKVARSIVADITSEPDSGALASAIRAMAHHLGLQVMAEGVETATQLVFLRAEQYDAVQGQIISPSLSAADLTSRLTTTDWLPPLMVH